VPKAAVLVPDASADTIGILGYRGGLLFFLSEKGIEGCSDSVNTVLCSTVPSVKDSSCEGTLPDFTLLS
jgi:hypothetical protein